MMSRTAALLTLSFSLTVAAAFAQQIPRPAPEYAFQVPGAGKLNLSQYKGKVIALEFLLTTCPHCQATTRTMAKLNNELGAKGFQPLGVAINPDADVPRYAKEFGANYPVGSAPRETVYAFLQKSIMSSSLMMPQLVLIDRAGNIRAQYSGTDAFFVNEEANLRKALQDLLAEGGAAKKPAAAPAPAVRKKAS